MVRRSFQLWAKTGSEGQWHALPYHLLDVAAAAEALWDTLPVPLQSKVQTWLGSTETGARATIAFLAASHDIGKANPFFQAKSRGHQERLSHWGLAQTSEVNAHGQATWVILFHWLSERHEWPIQSANQVASAIGAHHGAFFQDCKWSCNGLDKGCWKEVAFGLLDELEGLLQPSLNAPEPLGPFSAWLAGFVSVADWLGSHYRMTTFQHEPMSLATYLQEARLRARDLLEELEFQAGTTTPPLGLEQLLPPGCPPKAMQIIAHRIAPDCRFAIIEAPTGEGKTEAALALCEPWRAEGRGIYFALPTMATANGLVSRIDRYLQYATGDPNMVANLMHSLAWLVDRNIADEPIIENPDDDEQAQVAFDWFSHTKRGLLRPYGVGTVDQPLIAALLVKHFFVRLFALAGKVVVIDEVHAYDHYMDSIIEVLLAWLKALDCRVVLLSATLPPSKRQSLLEAWGAEAETATTYPSITWVDAKDTLSVEPFEASPKKPVSFQMIEADGLDLVLEELQRTSGTGVAIVNTVRRAIETYRVVGQSAREMGIEPLLFHARFTAEDRSRIEGQVVEWFGKNAQRGQPRLLIATQVVEQSLDLDFDFMVSDLAPMDLLIQRAGRLHRHCRALDGSLITEPDERPDPVVWVVEPPNKRPYESIVMDVTREKLDGLVVRQPTDVAKAVAEVYEDERVLKDASRQKREWRQQVAAGQATIPSPEDWSDIGAKSLKDEPGEGGPQNDKIAKTRLEDLPSISLVIATPDRPVPKSTDREGRRQLALQTVRLSAPAAQVNELEGPPAWKKTRTLRHSALASTDTEGKFETASWYYCYDPEFGLQWGSEEL